MSRKDYTAEEITAGLLALVMWAGNQNAASRALREQGINMPASTLDSWKSSKADEYNALREKHSGDLEQELVRKLRETAISAIDVQQMAVDRARERLETGKDIQPAQTAASMAKSATGSIDKLLALTGRPSTITEHRSPEEVMRGLIAAGVLKPVEDQPALPAGAAE